MGLVYNNCMHSHKSQTNVQNEEAKQRTCTVEPALCGCQWRSSHCSLRSPWSRVCESLCPSSQGSWQRQWMMGSGPVNYKFGRRNKTWLSFELIYVCMCCVAIIWAVSMTCRWILSTLHSHNDPNNDTMEILPQRVCLFFQQFLNYLRWNTKNLNKQKADGQWRIYPKCANYAQLKFV